MSDQAEWSLSSDQRKSTVARVAANIATISFSKGQQISDADAERAAENAERKAYTVARVEAKTTTGVRPHSETYEAYTRLMSQVLQLVCYIYCAATSFIQDCKVVETHLQEACLLGAGGNHR